MGSNGMVYFCRRARSSMSARHLPQPITSSTLRVGALTAGLLAAAATAAPGALAAPATAGACPAWAIAATSPPAPAAGKQKAATRVVRSAAGPASSIAYGPRSVSVGPTKLLVSATVGSRAGATAVIMYGRGTSLTACSTVQRLAPGAV